MLHSFCQHFLGVVSTSGSFSCSCADTVFRLSLFPEVVVDVEEAEEEVEEEEEGVPSVPVTVKVPKLSHRKQSRHDAVAASRLITV